MSEVNFVCRPQTSGILFFIGRDPVGARLCRTSTDIRSGVLSDEKLPFVSAACPGMSEMSGKCPTGNPPHDPDRHGHTPKGVSGVRSPMPQSHNKAFVLTAPPETLESRGSAPAALAAKSWWGPVANGFRAEPRSTTHHHASTYSRLCDCGAIRIGAQSLITTALTGYVRCD